MFGKINKVFSFGALLGVASTFGNATMLDSSAALVNVLAKHSKLELTSTNHPVNTKIDQNIITSYITGDDIDRLLREAVWKDDQTITKIFNDRYENTLHETCWYLNTDQSVIVVVDKSHYNARIASLMKYCGELYDKKQLKKELNIPESRNLSLSDLKQRKVNFDIASSNHWIGDISRHLDNLEAQRKLFNNINNALLKYIDMYGIKGASENRNFLFTLMGMLYSYPKQLNNSIRVRQILTLLYQTEDIDKLLESVSENSGKLIYNWFLENDESFLGEYRM